MAVTSKHESKFRAELNRLKAAVETARESVREAEGEVRARKSRLRAVEEVHQETLDAWLRGDEDLPPRQAELFDGDDQVEADEPRVSSVTMSYRDKTVDVVAPKSQPIHKAPRIERGEPGTVDDAIARARAVDPPPTIEVDAPDWRSTPLRDAVRYPRMVEMLAAHEFATVGDVAEVVGLYGSLTEALGELDPEVVPAIRESLRAWLADNPDVPREVFGVEVEASEAQLIDGLLGEALWPEGVSPAWADVRKDGASNADVLDELREIWDDRRIFHARDSTPGYTVQGGEHPRFWVGFSLSRGAAPAMPTLAGDQLAEAVRRVLRIPTPEAIDAGKAAPQPKPKPKTAKARKPKEVAK